jgi:hypothetical protein
VGKLQQISTEVLFSALQVVGAAFIAAAPVILAYGADRNMA